MECRLRIEAAISETEEGKVRVTRAILRKDAPQPPEPAGQGGGEREMIPPVPPSDNVRRNSSEPKPPIPARDEMNENMDDLPARDSAHGPRDGLDSAHGSQTKQPGLPETGVAGRGTTVRGQHLINALREEREAQLRRQRAPKRKGNEPTDDGSREPLRGTLPPPIPPGATVPRATMPSASASIGSG